MSYLKQQKKMRKIVSLITEYDTGNKLKNLLPGTTKDEPLVDMQVDPRTLEVSEFYQRQFSVTALNSYRQYNPQLARRIIWAQRPQRLGGHRPTIDGQHTAGLGIYAGVPTMPSSCLVHPEDRTLEECIEVESKLFHAYNTARKNPTRIDSYRAGLCFDEPEAVRFQDILESCNLKIEGLGDEYGDELASTSASRFIKTIEQYGETHRAYIPKAVNIIRRHYGAQEPGFKYRDDFIHGLVTLLVFLDEGRDCKGAGLKKKKQDMLEWIEKSMPHTGQEIFLKGTGGGNSHYKIVHRIIRQYNSIKKYTSISHSLVHKNGIWNEEFIGLSLDNADDKKVILETRKDRLAKVGAKEYLTANFPFYED